VYNRTDKFYKYNLLLTVSTDSPWYIHIL